MDHSKAREIKPPKINYFSQGRQTEEWERPVSLVGLLDLRFSRLILDSMSHQATGGWNHTGNI